MSAPDIAPSEGCASPPKRQRSSQPAFVLGVTGSSRSGKSTLCRMVEQAFRDRGRLVRVVSQDAFQCSSHDNSIMWQGRLRKTWEGPQFTSWNRFHAAVSEAREQCGVVLVDGYMLLDCPAELHAMFDGILWVSSTQEQVIARRAGYPREAKYRERGWPSKEAYAEHCVWPAHVAYEQRVQHLLSRETPPNATLPADEGVQARVQRALSILACWNVRLADATTTAAATASSSFATSSTAAAAATSASSVSSDGATSTPATAPPTPPAHPAPTHPAPVLPAPALLTPALGAFAPSVAREHRLVLVTHGSMNPVHQGHVAMMLRARSALEAEGFAVVAGVLAITRASHIRGKGVAPMSDAERLRLLELACKPHDWLTHCGGEGIKAASSRKFAHQLLPTAQTQHGEGVLVAQVEGSDVFLRYTPRAMEPTELRVVVARGAAEQPLQQHAASPASGGASAPALSEEDAARAALANVGGCKENVLVLPPDETFAQASSTAVRAAVQQGDAAALTELCGEAVALALV